MTAEFKGIIPPVSIILNDQGELDTKGMALVIDYLIDAGVNGLFFLGSGGEFTQMSVEERKEVADFTTNYVNKRVPVLIGTGSSNTKEAILLSKHAEEIGADGVVVINPYYWQLTEDNLLKHFGNIANSVDIPILLYNFPNLTGQGLSPELVLELANRHNNIVGIKETVESVSHIRDIIFTVKAEHEDFCVFAGFDDHLLNTLTLGGDGAICASANFAPEVAVGTYKAYVTKDFEKAIELHRTLALLPTIYRLDSPFITVVKEAMKLRGLDISTYVLPPSRKLSQEKIEELASILKPLKLL